MVPIELRLIQEVLLAALREDVGSGDVTTRATVAEDARGVGRFVAKEPLVVSGLQVIEQLMRKVDPSVDYRPLVKDADFVEKGTVLAEVRGSARSILIAERTTLNLIQRMCGIATQTRAYVERVKGTNARVVDTRKTVPGLRALDKYAVACGGGMNHRMGLFDGVLIKNNHLAFHHSVAAAIVEARRQLGHLVKIEVELQRPEQVTEAIEAGADVILLDNFTVDQTRQAVAVCAGRVPIESSGGITLNTIREFAEAGANYISVGALTHSVSAADIHLQVTAGNSGTLSEFSTP